MAKKEEHKTDLLESSEALAEKLEVAETWAERNPKIIIGIVTVLLLVAAAYFGYQYFIDKQDAEAQSQMFQAVNYFESDSLDLALNGDGNNLGFLAILDDYANTPAGNLANFYTGNIYLKQGKFNLARLYLEDFSSSDFLIQARAYSLIGDTYMEEKKFEDAAEYYAKAAGYQSNKYYSPGYLMKEALAHEKAGNPEKARQVYARIIEKYWDAAEVSNAKKFKARLESNP
jgi:TolA-binding protein